MRTLDCNAPVIATVLSPLGTDESSGVTVQKTTSFDMESVLDEEDVVVGEDNIGGGEDGGVDGDLFLPSVGCRSSILG